MPKKTFYYKLIPVIAITISTSLAFSDVYKYTDENGVTIFSNTPKEGAKSIFEEDPESTEPPESLPQKKHKKSPIKKTDKPTDYFSDDFVKSNSYIELRDVATKCASLVKAQSNDINAYLILRGTGTSVFKEKKYFQMKMRSTVIYNSLRLEKYAIGKLLFDDSIRKVLGPLNGNIGNSKTLFGYDLIIYGNTKNFLEKYSGPDKIEYRFLIPIDVASKYKNKDISGQKLLDQSVILMNDERIELKLQ